MDLPPVTPIIDVTTPGSTEGRTSPRTIGYSNGSVQSVTTNSRYQAWRTLASTPTCGYRLRGSVTVYLRTNYLFLIQFGQLPGLKARLFSCSTSPAPPQDLSDTQRCTALGAFDGLGEIQGAGLSMTPVELGTIDVLIPADRHLRLKVTTDSRGFSLFGTPSIQWGYESTNELNNARIAVVPAPPP